MIGGIAGQLLAKDLDVILALAEFCLYGVAEWLICSALLDQTLQLAVLTEHLSSCCGRGREGLHQLRVSLLLCHRACSNASRRRVCSASDRSSLSRWRRCSPSRASMFW